ncbi:serine hydrolase domain-containing protein [Gracilibacillus thailandensis]|uniref:Serine hydrolase n=1 Tax=Gracilibacillus thailandensis TaxID=563735 RepID=A0A6N7QZT7_9BACI|nr:serine hydrolase [Gracilibacillus thailandensis]MRI66395.1 serine hydrolase [Gracilibacillus thailandensis]
MLEANVVKRIKAAMEKIDFSGTVIVQNPNNIVVEKSYGFANRSEYLENKVDTRFGIASGCKLFTSIAICQLVERGKLSFETKLQNCLDISLPHFDSSISIHHLLTHTSGIPDYFDEEVMDDFEVLWIKYPMYTIRRLEDFLPLFQQNAMKLQVGERFHYNNAGYILLGLIVEQASNLSFSDYIQEHIFNKAGMDQSGYFEFDALPQNTALGYMDFSDGSWKTNIYSLPVKGGSDGGAYTTVKDMIKLWDALIRNQLLSVEYTKKLFTPYVKTDEQNSYYGYGVWIEKKHANINKYHVMGYDPGVSFHSAYYPENNYKVVVCSNKSEGAYDIMKEIENEIIIVNG